MCVAPPTPHPPPNCFDAAAIGDDDYSACPHYTRTYSLADADEPERRSSGRVSEGRNDSKTTHKGEERQRGGGTEKKHKNKTNKKNEGVIFTVCQRAVT